MATEFYTELYKEEAEKESSQGRKSRPWKAWSEVLSGSLAKLFDEILDIECIPSSGKKPR